MRFIRLTSIVLNVGIIVASLFFFKSFNLISRWSGNTMKDFNALKFVQLMTHHMVYFAKHSCALEGI